MSKLRNILLLTFLNVLSLFAAAQNPNTAPVEMADVLHQNGKIYLVVLVLVTIFAGILFLLIRIEQKLNKLEKRPQ